MMRRALSTHLFADQKLTTGVLEQIQAAEIEQIEISGARQHIDYRKRSQIAELGFWLRDAPLKVHSMHSPMYTDEYWGRSGGDTTITITEPMKARRIQMVDEIKRAIEIAETIPFRYLIQHVGVRGEAYSERAVDAAFTSLEELKLFAKHRGVEILLENIPNELSSAERLLTFLERTHLGLRLCFDTGHAHMNEGVATAYKMLKPLIRSTHVHDNDGREDLHLFPFAEGGSVDWARAMTLLGSEPEQYPLLLELKGIAELEHPLDDVRRTFDRLEGLRLSGRQIEEDQERQERERQERERREREGR